MSYYGSGNNNSHSSTAAPQPPLPNPFMQGVVASAAPQYSLVATPNTAGIDTGTPQQQQYQAVAAAAAAAAMAGGTPVGYPQWAGARQFYPQQQQQQGFNDQQQSGGGSPYGPYYARYNHYYASATALPRPPVQPSQIPQGYYNGVPTHQGYPQAQQQQQQQPSSITQPTTAPGPPLSSMPQSATSPAPAGGAVMLGGSAGKGGPSASHQWQQHIQGRPYSQAQPQQTAPSHAPRYSVPQQQQQASGMQQTQTPPKPLTVANPAAGAMVVQSTPRPKQGLSRPGQGVARSGSRYDQRQRMGKGGKGAATTPVLPTQVTPRANPVAPQPAQRVTPPPRPAVLPERTMPQVTAVVQSSGATPSMPPAATVVGCRDRTPVRPMPKAALQTAAAPPASSTNSAPPPPRSHMAMVTPTVVQSGIAISDTRKTAAANSTGPKYSELMASVLPPLRPGEAEFVLEMWTDKRARFPLRSTVLSSRWQSSPEHTCRHRMQIFPRGYQLRDLPASQRKPTDSWLAVNVVVENEPKPQSPFVGAAYPWAAQSLNKQVMLWIPNYKSPSTSIIRYGPGVFSKEQPTL
ncbi:hypothetical protein FOZ63_030164, partial [Perkinsus olseni]